MKCDYRVPISWMALLFTLTATVLGQQSLRGSIGGTVKDDTGAALPGANITVTSPALQVPQVVRVSDERGEYQIPDLPPGSYRVTYELSGFATLVRDGIVLTSGFAARVDADMKVATLAETITVSGETPLVDVTSTRGGTTVSKDLISSVPANLNYRDLLLLVGGTVSAGSPPETGSIGPSANGFNSLSYGAGGGTTIIEGVKMMPNESPDFMALEEVDVKTFGNSADVDTPGAAVQLVVKSGGNQFHGKYSFISQHERFQSNNIDAALRAQGINTGNGVVYFADVAADLGGRIIRDKLWFYGGAREQRNKRSLTGYAQDAGPDGKYATGDDTPGFPTGRHMSVTGKISYQATPKHRFVGFWQYNPDYDRQRGDRFTPRESSMELDQFSQERKPIEWQGTLSNRLLISMMYGAGGYAAKYFYECGQVPSCDLKSAPRLDRNTGLNTGPGFVNPPFSRTPWREQLSGTLNYLPAWSFLGTHDLQTGYRLWWGTQTYTNPHDPKNLDIAKYQLIYDTVGGVAHRPVEMAVTNVPVEGVSRQDESAVYIQDAWRLARRLTVNVGLRWERQVHYVPPQVKVQGRFGAAGSFPEVSAGSWNAWAPRVGAAFDLTGDGKTVVKGTYGWFNEDLGVNGYSQAFNQNSLVTYTYRWRDQDGNDDYTPGEVNLDLNGADFLTVSGATNNRVNPNLLLPHTHEASASFERELGRGMSVRTLFVYKKIVDSFQSVNVLRPPSAYNRAFSRRDPGGDGVLNTVDDGAMVTFYDYDPAYRGAAFVSNMNVNSPAERDDSFKNIEVMLTKRQTGKWFANSSFLGTKNQRWLIKVRQSPNDDIFAVDKTWDLSFRLAGGYNMPGEIKLAMLYQAYSGLQRQRTNVFRAADPAGGPSLPSSSTITLRMEPFGAMRGPFRQIMNVRAEKTLRLSGARRVTAGIDVFNAFNSNVPWGTSRGAGSGVNGITDVSGPSYGYVLRIVVPRVLRFTVGYEF